MMVFKAGQYVRGYYAIVLKEVGGSWDVDVVFSRKKYFGGVFYKGRKWECFCWGEEVVVVEEGVGEWFDDFGGELERGGGVVVEMGGLRCKVLRWLVDKWGLVVLRWVEKELGGLCGEWVEFGGGWFGDGIPPGGIDGFLGRDFELFEVVCRGFGGGLEVDWVESDGWFVKLRKLDGNTVLKRLSECSRDGVDVGLVKRVVGVVGGCGWGFDASGIRIGGNGEVEFCGEVGWVSSRWIREMTEMFNKKFLVIVFCSFFDKYVRFLCHKKLKVGSVDNGEVGLLESFGYGIFEVGRDGGYIVNGVGIRGDFKKDYGCVFDDFVWNVVREICRCWKEWVFDESPFEAIKEIVCRYCGFDVEMKVESIPLFSFEFDKINNEVQDGMYKNGVKGNKAKSEDRISFLDMFDW